MNRMTNYTKLLIAMLLMIPFLAISQDTKLTITLEREQWKEIRQGLEQGKIDAQSVEKLKEALDMAQLIRGGKDEIIKEQQEKIKILNNQITEYERGISDIEQRSNATNQLLINERNKRFGLSAFVGPAVGVDPLGVNIVIGIGVSYNILRF